MYKEFATIYDKFMEQANYDEWYDLIRKKLIENNFNGTDVMDLGCGTGEILIRLKNEGYKVLGVDLSDEMLLVAKKKMEKNELDIPLVKQDMTKLRLPVSFDLVVSLFDTINCVHNLEQLETVFKNVNIHLSNGGFFIFDVATKKLFKDMFKNGVFFDDRDDLTVLWRHKYDRKLKMEKIYATFFVKEGKQYSRIDEIHFEKIFKDDEIEVCLEKAGFDVIEKYNNEELAGERIFYIVQKNNNMLEE